MYSGEIITITRAIDVGENGEALAVFYINGNIISKNIAALFNFHAQNQVNSIKIITKPNITLGELDYTNIDNFELEISNYKKGSKEFEQLLRIINVLPKFLGAKYFDPRLIATKKFMIQTKPWSIFEWVEIIYIFLVSLITGKTQKLTYDSNLIASNNFYDLLKSHSFIENLMDVANRANKYKEILEHYQEKLITSNIANKLNELKALDNEKLKQIKIKVSAKYNNIELIKNAIMQFDNNNMINQVIILNNQNIDDICVRIITKWLSGENGYKCKELDLSNNQITDHGAELIANLLQNNKSLMLRNLYINGNNISDKAIKKIKNAVKNNFTLRELRYV